MKPPPFEYAGPGTLEEAVSLLGRHEGEAKVLSGGQSLIPLLADDGATHHVRVVLG